MIGILIISHCDIGKELLRAAKLIMGSLDATDTISITNSIETENLLGLISEKIKNLDSGKGVIILTDMFGGTPTNLALSFFEKGRVEVVTGVNLPMLIDIAQNRTKLTLSAIGQRALDSAKKNMVMAGKFFSENP